MQGYGQTEASPLISCNFVNFNDPQTVGFPVKNTNVKISKLAQGLPVGGEIETSDDGTLISAFKNRRDL